MKKWYNITIYQYGRYLVNFHVRTNYETTALNAARERHPQISCKFEVKEIYYSDQPFSEFERLEDN